MQSDTWAMEMAPRVTRILRFNRVPSTYITVSAGQAWQPIASQALLGGAFLSHIGRRYTHTQRATCTSALLLQLCLSNRLCTLRCSPSIEPVQPCVP